MLDWILFIALVVGPGTIEMRATRYATADDCNAARVQAITAGIPATCERRPSA